MNESKDSVCSAVTVASDARLIPVRSRRASSRLRPINIHDLAIGITMHLKSFRIMLALVLLLHCLACVPGTFAQQQPTPSTVRLAKIEFTGLERYNKEQVIAESGLQVGQQVDVETLDAASNRLLNSGLFQNLSYRFTIKNGEGVITFIVEEAKSKIPVVFDNFVWFSDEELAGAVRKAVPTFDGTAPEAGGVTESIVKALSELLAERKIAGRVEYTPSADPSGKNSEHVFAVKGANVRVCELNFPGARAVPAKLLVQKSAAILSNEFSRNFVSIYAEGNLIPLYHERGYLRAGFLTPQAKLLMTPECENGVAVAVPVEEGAAYLWDGAEWAGSQTLTAPELDAALGMKRGDVANGVKIESGLDSVRKAYGRKGHLAARLRYAPDFDDATRRVVYRFDLNEGPLYRMGLLSIDGLSEADANNLRTRWRLLPREPYDASYIDEFIKNEVRDFLKSVQSEGRSLGSPKITSAVKPDHEKLTVDVAITFKQ
ncbi:MAG: hypothetical protein H0W76_19790 [Pyrinomonadaceae bacterium]|nr:hypothetical protein [Pyrinomonadaceae bacterium]